MLTTIFAGMAALTGRPETLLSLGIGTLAGIVAGLAPGVSGRSALLIALPFVLGLAPITAAVFLVALHASAQISGTVPAVLFGAPTSASEAATAVDGYPLARRGKGALAIGAILSSSTLGGVGGALALLLLAPLGASLVLSIGSPEIAALAFIGIIAIAAVSSSGLAVGIVVGSAGALFSTVGLDAITGIPRFTFGGDALLDGFGVPAVVAGIIAIPELLTRFDQKAPEVTIVPSLRNTLLGCAEPFRHGWLALRSSLIGFVVGLLPGLGTSVAVWLAYGHATRTAKSDVAFGEGAIAGIVAPECANGAKEGGAFLPTLLLGVPGSSGMAILLGAFAIIGIRVGPGMFSATPQLPATIAFTVLLADVLAMIVCLALAPIMIRLASLNRAIVVSVSLAAAAAAAYLALPQHSTAFEILGFGALGVVLAAVGISRPPLLIGFIVAPILESALRRSSEIYGLSAFQRPGVIAIMTFAAFAIVFALLRQRRPVAPINEMKLSRAAIYPLAGLALVFAATIALALNYGGGASILPILVSILGLAAAFWALARLIFRASPSPVAIRRFNYPLMLLLAVGLVLTGWLGPVALALPLANLGLLAIKRRAR